MYFLSESIHRSFAPLRMTAATPWQRTPIAFPKMLCLSSFEARGDIAPARVARERSIAPGVSPGWAGFFRESEPALAGGTHGAAKTQA